MYKTLPKNVISFFPHFPHFEIFSHKWPKHDIIHDTGSFFNWPPLVQYQNEKRLTSQPDALSHEGILGNAAPVGSLAFFVSFRFGTERGGGG